MLPALCFGFGVGCTLISFMLQNITFINDDLYHRGMTNALALTCFAMICWMVTIWRGNLGWRVGAILMIIVALWIFDYRRTLPMIET